MFRKKSSIKDVIESIDMELRSMQGRDMMIEVAEIELELSVNISTESTEGGSKKLLLVTEDDIFKKDHDSAHRVRIKLIPAIKNFNRGVSLSIDDAWEKVK